MNEPTFDSDGYPTAKTLAAIENWKYNEETKFVDLLEFVNRAWHWEDYMRMEETKNSFGDDIYQYICTTGGWSGNESLITAMSHNRIFWALCWKESHRGGRHVFEVRK